MDIMVYALAGRLKQTYVIANNILIPYVTEYNAKHCKKSDSKYAKIIRLLNVKNIDYDYTVSKF